MNAQAYIYRRFSTDEQEFGSSETLVRQLERCQAMAVARGWTVVEILTDKGRSAFKGEHLLPDADLGRFMIRLRHGEIPSETILIADNLSRLSRLPVDEAQAWIYEVNKAVLGVFLLGRWLLRNATGGAKAEGQADGPVINPRTSKPFGEGMGIYSTFNVPEEARDTIERAIQNDMFKPKGKTEEGRELLYITTPTQDWLAVVEVTDAIMITAAYKTSADTVDQQVADYLSA